MKIIEITTDQIKFNDGTTLEYYHDQDCCENVYADFESLKDTGIMNKEFKKIQITGVKDSGFRLNGYFVPCYNEQNGYYSSVLEVVIRKNGKKEKVIDISNFTEERYC